MKEECNVEKYRMGDVPDKMRSRGGEGAIVKELQKAGDVRQSLYTVE